MCFGEGRLASSLSTQLTDWIFIGLYRLFAQTCRALVIVKPDTVIRWHRAGFRSYWRWKSRRRCGRPTVSLEIRRLIREMSLANPLWGVLRIHGELLKLGIEIGQTSVAKYMARRRALRRRIGRRSFVTTLTVSRRWTFRGSDNLVPTALWVADHGPRPAVPCGLGSPRIQRPNGSPIN
jgi:hypothetical protein